MAMAMRNRDDHAKTKRWLVRNEQGKTFGPVDFETLNSWACDGRLAPTNEVSENGTDWKLVTAQSGLAMDWVAEVTPGTFYGPIHKAAMEELVKGDSITAHVSFFKRHALDAQPVHGPADPQVDHLRQQLKAQMALAKQQAEVHAAELVQMRRQAAAEAELSKQQASVAAAEMEKVRQQAADSEAQANAARQQIAAQAEQARVTQQQMSEKMGELERQSTQARQEQVTMATRLTELRGELAQARQQAEGLRTLFHQAEAVLGAQPEPEDREEPLEAEPLEPVARPPERPKRGERPVEEAEVLPPERPNSTEKPPVINHAGRAKPGLSMADLERQARCELERLGAQGSPFFKKKK